MHYKWWQKPQENKNNNKEKSYNYFSAGRGPSSESAAFSLPPST